MVTLCRMSRAVVGLTLLIVAISLTGCDTSTTKTPTPMPTTSAPTRSVATTASSSSQRTQSQSQRSSYGSGSAGRGKTTCWEWIALDDRSVQEMAEGKSSKAQQDVLKQMLSDHDKDTGEMNRLNAELAVGQFCFHDLDSGGNSPIENAIDWS
jgi:hypothetical protein